MSSVTEAENDDGIPTADYAFAAATFTQGATNDNAEADDGYGIPTADYAFAAATAQGEDYEFAPGGITLPGALDAGHVVPAPAGALVPEATYGAGEDGCRQDYVEPNRLGDRNSIFNLGDNVDGFYKSPRARPLAAAARHTAGTKCARGSVPSARKCTNLAAGGSKFCKGHTCKTAGCISTKSSADDACDMHTPAGGRSRAPMVKGPAKARGPQRGGAHDASFC